MRRILITCLAALIAVSAVASDDGFKRERKAGETGKDSIEGNLPPKLKVENWINTKPLKLEKLKGKVVLLDFWGTWCGPCRASIPHLVDLYKKHKKDGLVIIGVHTTSGAEEMAAYVKEHKLPYPVAADVKEGTVKGFHVDSFPDYYIIDRSGKLRFADLANSELDRALKLLLSEKAPEEPLEFVLR